MRRLVVLLALAVAACSSDQASAPTSPTGAELGAVHYHPVGGTALACTTSGFDTICRNP
jgi:hypothetical protein